jgi:hypothetical protein
MTISLFVQDKDGEHKEIDLDDVWIHSDVIDEDDMHAMLVNVIAVWALENGNTFDDITPMTVDDDDGQELEIHQDSNDPHKWIREVVQLYMWLNCDKHYCPDEAVLGYIDNQGWKWFDFDDLQDIEDEYHSEFDGDYEDFAKEYMDGCGDALPEWAERYFDYAEYGEALVDDFEQVSWGHKEFLFTQ